MALKPTDDKEVTEQLKRRSFLASILFGALLAICFAGTLEILGAGDLDKPMMIALILFAVGLPLNSLMVFATLHEDLFIRLGDSGRCRSVFLICAFSPVLGLACIFAHFSYYFALVFFASVVCSMYLLYRWTTSFLGNSSDPSNNQPGDPIGSLNMPDPFEPRLYYRNLYRPEMVERWDQCELTSQHPHGEPTEWMELRGKREEDKSKYPLKTHGGKGLALPSARDRYHEICVIGGKDFAVLPDNEKFFINEQAGVFAFPDPVHAFWYGKESKKTDTIVVFYGIELCPGPEPTSVLSAVIKKTEKLDRDQFLHKYFGGIVPDKPVTDMMYAPPFEGELDEDGLAITPPDDPIM